ncbi:MAG TPA: oligosaccharide flippase family protein [Phycisphaerae bacterium]|nr:oligosaccharide flippase family protein [Phycisphaerae bacterium]
MAISAKIPEATEPPVPTGLGQKALGGAIWTVGQTFGSKLAAIGQQYLLALLLMQEDFAPVAIAGFILGFASFGQQLGVTEILVRKHRNFARWAEIAFWLSLTAGLVGVVGVLAVAPAAAAVFRMPILRPFLVIGAISIPLDAMAGVPMASLTKAMRFRTLAVAGTVNVVGTACLTVALAALHFGAYSLIVPKPIMSLVMAVIYFGAAGVRLKLRPYISRWRFVFQDSRYFLVMNLFNTFLMQGDYLTSGLFFSKASLGSYYFAFNASTQTNQMIAGNMNAVLLPSFVRMDSPRRQLDAYVRICSLIAFVGVPACLLQTACARPLFQLLFGHKWDTAIPLFEVLSIGMLFILPSGPTVSMMKAQGRFKLLMVWTGCVTFFFLASVLCGALMGSVFTLALGVTIFYSVAGPVGLLVPVRGQVSAIGLLWRVYGRPVLIGGAAMASGILATVPIREDTAAGLALCVAIRIGVTAAIYLAGAALFMGNDLRETRGIFEMLAARFTGGRRAAPYAEWAPAAGGGHDRK